jgi:lipocalin
LVGVTATYTLLEDGFIQVVNKGFKDSLTVKKKLQEVKLIFQILKHPQN